MRLLIWKLKMLLTKLRYPNAGYFERVLLVAGYTKEMIDEMLDEAVKDGWINDKDDLTEREEVCRTEAYYMA